MIVEAGEVRRIYRVGSQKISLAGTQAWGKALCPRAVRKRGVVSGIEISSDGIGPTQMVQDNLPYLKSNN